MTKSDSQPIVDPEQYESLAIGKLRSRGKAITAARVLILRALATAVTPMSHGDFKRKCPGADKNSITNVLTVLEETGLTVRTGEGFVPYTGISDSATVVATGGKGTEAFELPPTIAQMIRNLVNDDSAVIRVEVFKGTTNGKER